MLSRINLCLMVCFAATSPWLRPASAQQTNTANGSQPPALQSQQQPSNGLTITIDDLAGPKGPGSAKSKGHHWKMEPGYGWWGPDGGFDDGFDGGFDGFMY